ncbi:MAG: ATP-grasp domain-containing protein, partial [Pseudomonadota bacterium]
MAALVAYTPTPVHEHPRVFNHDIMHCTADGVVGNHLYSGRVLGMTSPEDVIQLHPDLKPEWKHIQEHYYRINLPHTKQVIWDLDYEYMRGHPDHVTSVFFFDDTIGGARPDDAWARTVAYINSKNDFMALAKELKLDVPRTLCFESVGKITILDDVAFPCYLKAAISVSGVGIFRCETPADLRKAMSYFDNATPVQIQEEVRTDLFLNMQYRVTEKGLERFAATEQVLDGFTHMG